MTLHARQSSSLRFVVDASAGARLRTLDFGRGDVLTDASVHPGNWGATSWPSPQAIWGWPPPAFLDELAWRLSAQGEDFVELESPVGVVGETSMVVTKRFSGERVGALDCFRASYAMRCEAPGSRAQARMASWQISRVPGGGTSFFARGGFELTPVGPHAALVGAQVGSCLVFEHARLFRGESAKVHAHSSGCFLGHFSADGTRLLLALFEPVAGRDVAAGEGNVELFYSECGGYLELEVQGPAVCMCEGAVARLDVYSAELEVPQTLETLEQRVGWGEAQARALAGELSISAISSSCA